VVCGILAARGEGLGGNLDDVVDARQGLVMSSAQCQRGRSAFLTSFGRFQNMGDMRKTFREVAV